MKKTGFIILAGLIVLALSCCAGQQATAIPETSEVTTSIYGNVATASGTVLPHRWATLSFENGGRISWLAPEGTEAAAGDVLVRLDTADLENALAQAQAALDTADAQLARLKAGATPTQIASAEASVATAEANLAAAEGALAMAEASAQPAVDAAEAALAQAEGARDSAVAELNRAQAELALLNAGTRSEEIAIYEAQLAQAEALLWHPTNVHDELIKKDIGGVPEEEARFQMLAAQASRDASQAQLNLAKAGASENELASARAMVNSAQAQVDIATAGVSAADAALAQAQTALNEIPIAQAQVDAANAQLAQAKAQRDQIVNGATPEEIAVLEAQKKGAVAVVEQAKTALAKASLRAPYNGIVGSVYFREGEIATPGAALIVFGDASTMWVETSDLNEVDAARVENDSPVTVSFDALPEVYTQGKIIRMAPMAMVDQGGTNFTIIIEMEDPPQDLRWGMTAFVDIELE
ncbi:MAG: efflux RND transporter periplasmic adaptor subunit [Anaerolineales bacterium]|nr:efflux RND transporter periplasmic adaptor subunit [Anaerolineales bacterium]